MPDRYFRPVRRLLEAQEVTGVCPPARRPARARGDGNCCICSQPLVRGELITFRRGKVYHYQGDCPRDREL